MMTTASKAYAGLAGFAFVAFVNYMGAVGGDRVAYVLLVGFSIAFGLLAWVATGRRVDDEAPTFEPSSRPGRIPVDGPGPAAGPSTHPLVVSLGVAVAATSAAFGAVFLLLGVAIAVLGLSGWFGQVWREHPSWTPAVGEKVSTRVVSPFALPLSAVLLGLVVVGSVSRILLNVSINAAVVVSLVLAAAVFAGCTVAALGTKLTPRLLGGVSGVAMTALVVAGITAGVRGVREEHHFTAPVTPVNVSAEGLAFLEKEVTVPLDKPVQLTFENNDPDYHNVAIYTTPVGGRPFIAFTPFGGPRDEVYSPVDLKGIGLEIGSYSFRCDFHPAMVGNFIITPGGGEDGEHEEEGGGGHASGGDGGE